MLKIYLSGACKNVTDEGREWRKEISDQLNAVADWHNKKIGIFNPVKYFTYGEPKHKTQKQVKEFYMSKLAKSDLVICNLDYSDTSIGTAQEIQFAVDHNIPVIGYGTMNIHPWLAEVDCQVVFSSMVETVDYIRDYYMDAI